MVDNVSCVLSERRTQIIVWTLLCLMPIVGMAVDLVAPSLPAIASGLQISNGIAKDVISIYLLGYAFGNFFTGFLTDALGRQKLIRISLLCFVIVSLAPVIFPRIEILLLSRFLQGLTLGAVAVLLRAICSDILPREKLVHLGTLFGTMWGLGPVVGPIIGGYLQVYFGWKAGFCFFALIGFLLLIPVFILVPETHANRHPLNLKTMKTNFIEVVSNRIFMSLVVLMGLSYSLIIVFNTAGPFLIQTKFNYSPVFFGHLAFYLGLVFLISTFCCRFLLKRFQMEKMLFTILNLFFVVALLMVGASYFFDKSITLVAIASGLMFFAMGFIFPMSMGKGMSLFRHISGTATATMYLVNVLITSLMAFLVSFITLQNTILLMWIYFLLMAMSMVVYWRFTRRPL